MKPILLTKINRRKIFFGLTMFLIVGLVLGIIQFEMFDELDQQMAVGPPKPRPEGTVNLIIKIPAKVIEVHVDGQLYKQYPVAVGKTSTPTPIGEWNVVWKDYGWGTGFGTRWMGLNVPWGIYGIHGTNKPWSIGKYASHGCIRMRNKDVEELFEWVPTGTPVRIEGQLKKIARELKYRSSGPDVVVLQLKLKELGFLAGRSDGLFGKSTEMAVRDYQKTKGYEETGVINKEILDNMGI